MNARLTSSLLALPVLLALTACGTQMSSMNADAGVGISSIAKPLLTVNGQEEITVNVGDELDFVFQSSAGTSAQGSAIADSDDTCSASSDQSLVIDDFLSLQGQTKMTVQPCQAGHTYTYIYKVTDENQAELRASEKAVIVHIKGEAKTAANSRPSFTVNGQTQITVSAGDTIHYNFDSGSDTLLSAKMTSDSKDNCGDLSAEAFLDANLSRFSGVKSEVIAKCQAGHSYKVDLNLKSPSSSVVETLEVLIHVKASVESSSQSTPAPTPAPTPAATPAPTPRPVQQPSFTVNGAASAIVKAGDSLKFDFNAGSGQFVNVSISSDGSDSCVANLGAKAWASGISSVQSGAQSETALSCQVGHTYTINYQVRMPDLSEVTLVTQVKVGAN